MKRYRIENLTLGKGATSKVFLGKDEQNLMVAIKRIKKTKDSDLEVNIFRSLPSHSHIISFIDYFVDNLYGYIVMEYQTGSKLGEIRTGKVHQVKAAVQITLSILEGLKVLHRNGILHCDISPKNILIRNDDPNTVKIIDFGSAVRTDEFGEFNGDHKGATKWYRPPELKKENNLFTAHLNQTSDLYSAASICLYLLTGKAPYRKKQACKQVNDRKLQGILRKATSASKQKRYQTAQNFIDALLPFA